MPRLCAMLLTKVFPASWGFSLHRIIRYRPVSRGSLAVVVHKGWRRHVLSGVRRPSRRIRFLATGAGQAPSSGEQPFGLAREPSTVHGEVKVVQMPRFAISGMPSSLVGARVLWLGEPSIEGCIHSIYKTNDVLTGEYWDVMGMLPALIPEGEVGIFGLGSGTVARIIHKYFPDRLMRGYELDGVVLDVSRNWMGLKEIEDTGKLVSYVGDCFSESASTAGGFAGIVVDLFMDNVLTEELSETKTWKELRRKLRKNGRIIVNLSRDDSGVARAAIDDAFEGEVSFRWFGENLVALTGVRPSQGQWASVPGGLKTFADDLDWWGGCVELSQEVADADEGDSTINR